MQLFTTVIGENVWRMTRKCLVCGLSEQYSGICGGTSYGQTPDPSLAWRKCAFSKKNNDDDEAQVG